MKKTLAIMIMALTLGTTTMAEDDFNMGNNSTININQSTGNTNIYTNNDTDITINGNGEVNQYLDYDALTNDQKNELKGDKGEQGNTGANGENGINGYDANLTPEFNNEGEKIHQVIRIEGSDESMDAATDEYARSIEERAVAADWRGINAQEAADRNTGNIEMNTSKVDTALVLIGGESALRKSYDIEHNRRINENKEAITNESEIREIVDNNLAKGIDSNTDLINDETDERIAGDEKTLSDAKDYSDNRDKAVLKASIKHSDEGDQLINNRITENQGNQAIRDGRQDDKIVENTSSINAERIERTQVDIRHDREIMNNSNRISQLDSKIDGVESQMSKGVASAVATVHAVSSMSLEKGDMGVGVGYGNFNGNSAISLGLGVRPTENINIHMSMGASQGNDVEYTVGAGASYKFHLFN